MGPEKEIVALWFNSKNYTVATNVSVSGNKDVFLLAVKLNPAEAIHVEMFASLTQTGNIMMDSSSVKDSVEAYISKRFLDTDKAVAGYLSSHGLKDKHKRMIIIGQLAKSIRQRTADEFMAKGVQAIMLEDVLAEVISSVDRVDHRSPGVRCLQLIRHALLSEPNATARLLASLNESAREELFLKMCTIPQFSAVLARKGSEHLLMDIFSKSTLANSEKLADVLDDALGKRRVNRLIRRLLEKRIPKAAAKEKSLERSLMEFLDD